jgi:uncharacterized NAD(P)/FAD-binding protein YdhS
MQLQEESRSHGTRRLDGPSGGRVIVVGGGASGVLLACHLLRDPHSSLSVTLIEKRPEVGQGIAFSTAHPDHLEMSAPPI